MVSRVSVRDVKCVPAEAGSTILHVASSQIPSLREAGLGSRVSGRDVKCVFVNWILHNPDTHIGCPILSN